MGQDTGYGRRRHEVRVRIRVRVRARSRCRGKAKVTETSATRAAASRWKRAWLGGGMMNTRRGADLQLRSTYYSILATTYHHLLLTTARCRSPAGVAPSSRT